MPIQISNLQELTSPAADDYIPSRDTSAGIDKRVSYATIAEYVLEQNAVVRVALDESATAAANTATLLAAMVGGGVTLELPAGTFAINNVIFLYDNVTIRGAGKPTINAAKDGFEGGTILQGGQLNFNSQRGIAVSDLGVDVSGVSTDGMGSGSDADGDQYLNIQNVAMLGTTGWHALLLTSGGNNIVRNLSGYKFSHCCAMRCSNSDVDGVYAEDCDTSAVIIKGAGAQNAHNNNVRGVLNVGTTAYSAGATLIYQADAMTCYNNVASNLVGRNCKEGVLFQATNGGSVYDNFATNVVVESSQYHALWVEIGNIYRNTIIGAKVIAVSSSSYYAVTNTTTDTTNRMIGIETPLENKVNGAFAYIEINGVSESDRLAASVLAALKAASIVAYKLRDDFTTAVAAGSVNNSAPVPGPGGNRKANDTNAKLSVAGGALTGITGGAGNFDYSMYYDQLFTRQPGLMLRATLTVTANRAQLGWMTTTPPFDAAGVSLNRRGGFDMNTTTLAVVPSAAGSITVGTIALSTAYQLAIVQRAAGNFYFIKGGIYTNWTLVWIDSVGTNGVSYVFAAQLGTTTAFAIDTIRVSEYYWLPAPVAADSFASSFGTTDGLTPEGVAGGLGVGGSGLSWTSNVGTFTVTGAKANASALSGGIAIATVDTGETDVMVTAKLTRGGGNVAIVLRYADASNYVYANHTGTNAQLIKVVAGSPTTLINTAATYSASAEMRAECEGQKFRLFYNQAPIGAEQTIADAGLASGTKQGLYTSDITNTFDDFSVFARGSGAEYAELDSY